jgi:threonine dehydrogenase-like Zn-dependent dehydrogenase
VAIFGAGPLGLMAAHSAPLRGAAQVFVVDKEPSRLALAEQSQPLSGVIRGIGPGSCAWPPDRVRRR